MKFLRETSKQKRFFDVNTSASRAGNAKILRPSSWIRKSSKVLDLRGSFFKRYPALVLLVALFSGTSLFAIQKIFTKGASVDFFATACLGSWQNPHFAQGHPETFQVSDFPITAENSSVMAQGDGKIFCGGFVPSDYENKGEIKKVALTLVWRVGESEQVALPEEFQGQEQAVSSTEKLPIEDQGSEVLPGGSGETQSGILNLPLAIFGYQVAYAQEQVEESTPVQSSETVTGGKNEEPVTESSEESSVATDEIPTIILAPPLEASLSTSTATSSESFEPEPDLITTSTPPLEVEIPTLPPDENFVVIKYSLDGQIWYELQKINIHNWPSFTTPISLHSWSDLKRLQISVEGIPSTLGEIPKIYLDGMLVGVEYEIAPIQGEEIELERTEELPVVIEDLSTSTEKNFKGTEAPFFEINLDQLSTSTQNGAATDQALPTGNNQGEELAPNASSGPQSFLEKVFKSLDLSGRARAQIAPANSTPPNELTPQKPVVAEVVGPEGESTDIRPVFLTIGNQLKINFPEPRTKLRPGKYRMRLWVLKNGVAHYSEQDFTWGVLAANFNKSIYSLGDRVKTMVGVLDDTGHTICDADIRIAIVSPTGKRKNLSTQNGSIEKNPECGPISITDIPDYYAFSEAEELGVYRVRVVADTIAGRRELDDSFQVLDPAPYDVERIGPTRIFPLVPYGMTLKIKANTTFDGYAIEALPEGFEVTGGTYDEQEVLDGRRFLKKRVRLEKGDSVEFNYAFDAPDISPILYKLGPLALGSWHEAREWQIAGDAVTNSGSILLYGDTVDDDNLNRRILTATSTWTAEATTVDVTGEALDITHVVAKAAPTRNETIAGHLKTGGRLDFISFNGTTWSSLFTQPTTTGNQNCDLSFGLCHQPFDLAYEQLSGEALMVYGKTASSGAIFYRTWNGSATSSENQFLYDPGATSTVTRVRLVPRGEMLTDQRSDEMLFAVLDSNRKITAGVWNGSSFTNTSTMTLSAPTSTTRNFDVAWETISGNGIVMYASGTAAGTTPFSYKRRVNGVWDANPTIGPTLSSTIGLWAVLASDPISDRVSAGLTSAASVAGLNAQANSQGWPAIWKATGTAAWTLGLGDTSLEWGGIPTVFTAWLRYGSSTAVGSSSALFTFIDQATADGTDYRIWSNAGFGATVDIASGWTDDGNNRKLISSPNANEMMSVGVDSDSDLRTQRFDNGTNVFTTSGLSAEHNAAVGTSTDQNSSTENFAFDFAYRPYSPWSRNWRWYSGTSTANTPSSSPLAAENVAPENISANGGSARLRLNIAELGGNSETDTPKVLQFTTSTNPDASSTVWTDVGNSGSSTEWRYYDCDTGSSTCDNGVSLSSTTLSSSSVAGWFAAFDNGGVSTTMDHASTTVLELEFPIQSNNAQATTTYYFRAYNTYASSTAIQIGSPIYRQQTSNPATPCSGASACTYPSLKTADPNPPVVSSVSINNGSSITLVPNATTTVYVNYTVTDNDGCSQIFPNGNVTTTLFRSSVAGGSACDSSYYSCYIQSTSTYNCAGNSASATTTFEVYYFADATDASSTYPSDTWVAQIFARDSDDITGSGSSTIELNTLLAIDVISTSTAYGAVNPGSNTGAVNQTVDIKNAGNASSTLNVNGTALTGGSGSIATSSQRYATSTFTFGGVEQTLQQVATLVSGFLAPPQILGSSWATSTSLLGARTNHSAVAYKNYMYVLGGATTSVDFAPIQGRGVLGSWTNTTAFPTSTQAMGVVAVNDYLYAIGGQSAGDFTYTSTVRYALINTTGSIGSWANTTALPTGTSPAVFAIDIGTSSYIYSIGGAQNGLQSTATVRFGVAGSTGTIPSWTNTTALSHTRYNHKAAYSAPYVFIGGGWANSAQTSSVYFTTVNATGSLNSWTSTQSLPIGIDLAGFIIQNGFLYAIGGDNTDGATTTVLFAPIKSGGGIAPWQRATSLPFTVGDSDAVGHGGQIYILGSGYAPATATVLYGNISSRSLYWGLEVPIGVVSSTYTGTNTFTAVFSP